MKKFLPILFIIIVAISLSAFLLIKFKGFTCAQLQCNLIKNNEGILSVTSSTTKNNNIVRINDNQYYAQPNSDAELLRETMLNFYNFYQLDPYIIFEETSGDPAFNGDELSIRYKVCNYSLHTCESYFYYKVADVLDIEKAEVQNGALIVSALEDDYKTIESGYYNLNKVELIMQVDPKTKNLNVLKKIKSTERIDTKVGNQ